ncbi:hypothetical protein SAMN05216480_10234 [Pustulibacterium marinum]|uniref:Fibronectin type-III domain-containing protein n=1 Tax=Pustulibacterium marinum TaxID=1224947 RepID=A0A1I7FMM9_9FLAO|nr:hypothetical protein [Pustulibacterium marinum]SFU37433.1 hypothetical protein SAMN05216480_10234 [Pustulibacterium marinum]
MKRKVRISYAYMKDSQLNVFAGEVITKLTGNTNFTFDAGVLEALTAASVAYRESLEAATGGGMAYTAEKNIARATLLVALRKVAQIVNYQADGDEAKLLNCGFILIRIPTEVVLPAPINFSVVAGPEGADLILRMKANKDAKSYLFFVGPSETPVVTAKLQQHSSSSCTLHITGLEPGVKYACRAAYLGSSKSKLKYSSIQFACTTPVP